MSMMKKILACVLLVCMAVSMLSMGAVAYASDDVTEAPAPCTHDWCNEAGQCTLCTESHEHDWSDHNGVCKTCHYQCVHDWSEHNGTCKTCAAQCTTHDWSNHDGVCKICGSACQHTYPEHSCTCSTCGFVKGHTYAADSCICSVCGYAKEHVNTDGNCACDVCGAAMHTWADQADSTRKCSVCGIVCGDTATAHADADNNCVCDVCGKALDHVDEDCNCVCDKCSAVIPCVDLTGGGEDGTTPDCRCDNCGKELPHADADNNCVCDVCGQPCHQWVEISTGYYQCTKCSLTCGDTAHPHQWVNEQGINMGKCTVCGFECSHPSFVDGKCTVCQFDPFNTGLMTLAYTAEQQIDTFVKLEAAVSAGGDYQLTDNITMTKDLTVPTGKSLSLNLMDKAVTGGFKIIVEGTLTTTGTTGSIGAVSTATNGTVTVTSGNVTTLTSAGTTTINGGAVGGITATAGAVTIGADGVVGDKTNPGATVITLSGDTTSLTVRGTVYGKISKSGTASVTFDGGTAESDGTGDLFVNANNVITAAGALPYSISSADLSALNGGAKGSLTIKNTTTGDSLSFPKAALAAIVGAVGANDARIDISKSGDVYTLKVEQNAGGTYTEKHFSFGCDVTVKLGLASTPGEIVHKDASDAVIEAFYASPATGCAKAKAFTYADGAAELKVNQFSTLTVNADPALLPVIDTTARTGYAGQAYTEAETPATMIIAVTNPTGATGGPTIGAITGLPAGITQGTTAKNKLVGDGTAVATSTPVNLTVTASNDFGISTATVPLSLTSVVATMTNLTTGAVTGCPSIQDAINAAPTNSTAAGYKVTVCQPTTENVIIDRPITFDGAGKQITGSVSLTTAAAASILNNVKASSLTVNSTTATVNGSQTVIPIITANTAGTTITITGGTYNDGVATTSALRGSGSYVITGGSFDTLIPRAWCGNDANGFPVISDLNASTGLYDVHTFVPEITGVDHSGYHYRSSTNKTTLTFTTNIPSYYYRAASTGVTGDIESVSFIRDSTGQATTTTQGYTINVPTDGYVSVTVGYSRLNALATGGYDFRLNTPFSVDPTHSFEIGTTVKTGDTSNIGLWAGIMGGTVLILGGVAFYLVRKSKKKGGKSKDIEK